jgi:hypothetical protein
MNGMFHKLLIQVQCLPEGTAQRHQRISVGVGVSRFNFGVLRSGRAVFVICLLSCGIVNQIKPHQNDVSSDPAAISTRLCLLYQTDYISLIGSFANYSRAVLGEILPTAVSF